MIKLLLRAPGRFAKSFGYTRDAFVAMWRKEESFRLELIALTFLTAALLASPWPWWKVAAMIGCFFLIPMTEALNSAIEDCCDLVTREHHELVKNAKDKGALAVLLAILVNGGVLVALLLVED